MKLEEALKVSEVTNRLDNIRVAGAGGARLTYTFTRTIVITRNYANKRDLGNRLGQEYNPTSEELQDILSNGDWEPI